jgi:rubrerythrin
MDYTTNRTLNKTPDRKSVLKILESNWQAEMRGFHTYETLSKRENDPQRRSALRGLAYAEKHHADLWAEHILALEGPEPVYRGSNTGEADSLANRVGGKALALRRLELDESHDIAKYAKQLEQLGR